MTAVANTDQKSALALEPDVEIARSVFPLEEPPTVGNVIKRLAYIFLRQGDPDGYIRLGKICEVLEKYWGRGYSSALVSLVSHRQTSADSPFGLADVLEPRYDEPLELKGVVSRMHISNLDDVQADVSNVSPAIGRLVERVLPDSEVVEEERRELLALGYKKSAYLMDELFQTAYEVEKYSAALTEMATALQSIEDAMKNGQEGRAVNFAADFNSYTGIVFAIQSIIRSISSPEVVIAASIEGEPPTGLISYAEALRDKNDKYLRAFAVLDDNPGSSVNSLKMDAIVSGEPVHKLLQEVALYLQSATQFGQDILSPVGSSILKHDLYKLKAAAIVSAVASSQAGTVFKKGDLASRYMTMTLDEMIEELMILFRMVTELMQISLGIALSSPDMQVDPFQATFIPEHAALIVQPQNTARDPIQFVSPDERVEANTVVYNALTEEVALAEKGYIILPEEESRVTAEELGRVYVLEGGADDVPHEDTLTQDEVVVMGFDSEVKSGDQHVVRVVNYTSAEGAVKLMEIFNSYREKLKECKREKRGYDDNPEGGLRLAILESWLENDSAIALRLRRTAHKIKHGKTIEDLWEVEVIISSPVSQEMDLVTAGDSLQFLRDVV